MLCPKCHTLNRENARFCKGCGIHFTAEQLAEAQGAINQAPTTQEGAVQASENASAQAPASANANAAIAAAQPIQASEPPQTPSPPLIPEVAVDEDIAHAPTQIISPQEMAAMQARRWQHEQGQNQPSKDVEQHEQPSADVVGARLIAPSAQYVPMDGVAEGAIHLAPTATPEIQEEQEPTPMVEAEAKNGVEEATGAINQAPTTPPPPNASSVAPQPDPALMETIYTPQPAQSSELAQELQQQPNQADPAFLETVYTPQPSPASSAQQQAQDPAAMETVYGDIPAPAHEEKVAPAQPASAQPVQPAQPAAAFPVLAVGTTLAKRYEVTQVVSEGEQEHVYQVADHQGYQRCWNCGSEQNTEGAEYCIDCGAALLNMTYTMHEYPATASKNQESHVLPGTIVNTFMHEGKTYLIEQPQATQIYFPNGVHLLSASDSDAGNVRRGEPNEDSTLLLELQRVHESISGPVGVFVVADGMGGHDNGQGASRMAINVIAEHVVNELLMKPLSTEKAGQPREPLAEDDLIAVFKGSIEEANGAICHANQQAKTDMGSTVTGFMVINDHAYIINVGDSRTYMLRDGTLYQLTNDHSLVGQLLAGGLIEPDDVYTHPQRSQIFRSLGDKLNTQVDDFKQQLHPGDILLSCSDGLWEMVRNPQITDILSNAPDPQTACTQLIEAANTNGGEDNVSAIVVFIR